MNQEKTSAIRDRLFVIAKNKCGMSDEKASDFAFHMVDWADDLVELMEIYSHPEDRTDDQISDSLHRILVHIPNHIAAAGKILTDLPVRDIFEVGALNEPNH